jgi:hypothetical protein
MTLIPEYRALYSWGENGDIMGHIFVNKKFWEEEDRGTKSIE